MFLSHQRGLVLSGGGARGAYQAGVMLGVSEIARQIFPPERNPFPVITGVSAGAINGAFLSASAHNFSKGTRDLVDLWRKLRAENVFKTDVVTLLAIGLRAFYELGFGGIHRQHQVQALLDSSPLRSFLGNCLKISQIEENLNAGFLRAFGITAVDYSDSTSISFIQSLEKFFWQRKRRIGLNGKISLDHILASSAIPLFFPPIPIGNRHYGDGSLRNMAPLSPAVHLGAKNLLIVSVKKLTPDRSDLFVSTPRPTAAKILSVMLNALLLDNTEFDMERLTRINATVRLIPPNKRKELGEINYVWIQPSVDLGELAKAHAQQLPSVIRYLIRGLGSLEQASEIISYLLFDPIYCGLLTEIGRKDAITQQESIAKLLLKNDVEEEDFQAAQYQHE